MILLLSAGATVWGFGGFVPAARLVMMTGVLSASVLALLLRGMESRIDTGIPVPAALLLCFAGIGLLQLMPWHSPTASSMHHAAVPEHTSLFSTTDDAGFPRSVSPARTRIEIATIVTVALALLTGFDLVRSRTHVAAILGFFAVNAAALAIAGVVQFSRDTRFLFWGYPVSYSGLPFASFVNRNNAAAYFNVGIACSLGLCRLAFGDSGREPSVSQNSSRSVFAIRPDRISETARRLLANLNTVQLSALFLVGINVAGVFCTTSRSGMLTALMASLIVIPLVTGFRRSLLAVPGVFFVAILAFWLLDVTGLNQKVVSELATLNDPGEAIQSRLNHWGDSLHAVRDFPGLGIGLGGYRYGSLPYQKHFTRTWFQFADNQYVQTVVEAGLPGLAIALVLLLCGLVASRKLTSLRAGGSERHGQSHRRHSGTGQSGRITTAVANAAGLAGLFISICLAIHSLFDFGAVVPGTAVAVAAIFGGLISVYRQRPDAASENGRSRLDMLIIWKTSPRISAVTRIACIAVACLFVPEMWNASRADRAAADSEAFRRAADQTTDLADIDSMRSRLTASLQHRPDDERLLREISRLNRLEFRRRIFDEYTLMLDGPVEEEVARRLWGATDPISVRETLDNMMRTGDSELAGRIAAGTAMAKSYPEWIKSLTAVRRRAPLMPGIHGDIAMAKKAGGATSADLRNDLLRAEFVEPHDVEELLSLGYLAAGRGRSELASRFWKRSIEFSPRHELRIVQEARRTMTDSDIVDDLLPSDFDRLIRLAVAVDDESLRAAIVRKAASLKPAGNPEQLSDDQLVGLAKLMQLSGNTNDAIDLLKSRLAINPDRVVILLALADHYESAGEFNLAAEQWRSVLYLDSDNQRAKAGLAAAEEATRARRALN